MDIADLHLIDAVATRGSFTAAGAQLGLSQPAVSARVAAVERAVGANLFTRGSRGARLTPAGQRYLGYLRRCLHLLADGARAAAAERPDPIWAVGVPASYAPALAPILTAAAADCEWPLSIHADHSTALRAELLDGRLDIAIATPGPLPDGMSNRHLLETPVVAVAVAVAVDPDRVDPDRRYAVHSWQESADAVISELLGRGIPRTHISIVSPATTAIALALHHHHVAVVPKLTASAELTCGKLTILDLRLPRLTAALDWLLPTRTSDHPAERYIAAVESQRNHSTGTSTSQ